jgi:Ca-activated chloride channel family protein
MWPIGTEGALLGEAAIRSGDARLLVGVVALALLLVLLGIVRGPHRIAVPSGRGLRRARSRIDATWILSLLLRCGALALLGAALARPVGLVPESPAGGEGVDLLIALDASGSMNALDATLGGRRVTRLDLARRVVSDFVRNREGDRIGLVVFGDHAFTQSPLTVDRRLTLDAVDRVRVGLAGDATALGEAIGLAVRRLRTPGAPQDTRRVILLLTDGRHNTGPLGPETASQIARLSGIRIHSVGIGTTGSVPFARSGLGEPVHFERVDLDEETLRSVARATGGQFFHARRPEDLVAVAAAIDRLEARPSLAEPRYRSVPLARYALAAALLLLLVEVATAHGLVRRLP